MRLLTTVLTSACVIGMLGGAAVSARADDWGHGWDHRDRGWHHGHDWRAERDWRWRHAHRWHRGYVTPRYYSYYNPPPAYYAPPGATFGFAIR